MSEDLELLRAWQAGDQAKGEQLVQRHMRSLYSFFRSMASSDVDDLIQRTWLACLASADKYRADGSFRGFLFGVARHEAYGYFRRGRREPTEFDPSQHGADEMAPSPSQIFVEQREQRLLLQALRQLPLDDQIALALSYWEDLNSSELARALDVPAATLRGRLARARKRLRRIMARLSSSPELLESTVSGLSDWAVALRDHLRKGEGVTF